LLVDSSGNVGIGTTAPGYKLDVTGDIRGQNNLYVSGNVGIGTTNPSAKLEVNGNIIASPPTADNHVATKAYVDAQAGGGCMPTDCTIVNSGADTGAACSTGSCDLTCPPGYKYFDIGCTGDACTGKCKPLSSTQGECRVNENSGSYTYITLLCCK